LTALLEERLVRRVREQGIGATGGSTVFTGQPLLVTGAIFPFLKKKKKRQYRQHYSSYSAFLPLLVTGAIFPFCIIKFNKNVTDSIK
jgi:hypothetical protein